MPEPIAFYFDFASPYGYFAATRIDGIARAHGREVAWRPIALGATFKLTGMKPTVEQPLRAAYFRRDIQRFARLLGVPFRMPQAMPMNGLAAGRAFWWLNDERPEAAKRLAFAVLEEHWGRGRDLSDAAAVARLAGGLGIDPAALLAAVQDPAVKARFRDETERSMALGVFGSPYVIVDGEPFWGADRLDQVERWLATGGW
ncbi:MAG: 2-hydroxychromene-2-carboxylate isomerase [Proteobacteria bacterium]|nr:2-hydroxychromene-2-carboxylate isomerase [Pseudomonadota bacterium]